MLNGKTFGIKNIDELIIDVHLPVNATLDRQLKNDETVIHTPKQENQESEKE